MAIGLLVRGVTVVVVGEAVNVKHVVSSFRCLAQGETIFINFHLFTASCNIAAHMLICQHDFDFI